MADINKNLKSICSFYASEWHLVTMLLPNLDQKINKGVKVTTILEKDLTKEDYKERYEILKKYQAFLKAQREKK